MGSESGWEVAKTCWSMSQLIIDEVYPVPSHWQRVSTDNAFVYCWMQTLWLRRFCHPVIISVFRLQSMQHDMLQLLFNTNVQ